MAAHYSSKWFKKIYNLLESSLRIQSMHPRGMHCCKSQSSPSINLISIHASARDATRKPLRQYHMLYHFNPRIREGCDGSVRCGVDPQDYFNPRIRGDATVYRIWRRNASRISIHASAGMRRSRDKYSDSG